MGPGFDSQIGLGVEPNAEDHDGEEAGDVARELPVFPLARLAWGRRGPVEGEALGPLLVARAGPAARTGGSSAAGTQGREQSAAEHGGGAA